MVADRIAEAKRFEQTNYSLVSVQAVKELILNSECWTDEDICYEIAALRDKDPDNP